MMAENPKNNMALMRHWFDIINENDVSKMFKEAREFLGEDYMLHDPSTPDLKPGAAEYLKVMEQQMAASADRKIIAEDMFAVDDKVVTRGVFEFLDLATQERIKLAFMVISRFEGGKVTEEWQIFTPLAAPS